MPAAGVGSRRHQTRFARVLVVVLPASLLLTFVWKQVELEAPRFEFTGGLPRFDDPSAPEAALLAPAPTVVRYLPPASADGEACDAAERAALLRVGCAVGGGADGGAGWLRAQRWNESADCCQWSGVSCARGRVSRLQLVRTGCRGTLPTELAQLRSLRVLDLNDNPGLGGTLPTELAALPLLDHVYFFGDALSGTLPPALGSCGALRELELSHCKLSGTLPAALPPRLQYTFLESNRVSGTLPAALAELRGLSELELSENRLSGSVPRALNARHLKHLDLQHNDRLRGVAKEAASSQCSGGGAKYLRGGAFAEPAAEPS